MTALRDLVATSQTTASVAARNEKVTAIARFLTRVGHEEVASVIGLLSGEPKQGRVGIGWAAVAAAADGVERGQDHDPIEIADVDQAIELIARTHGDGSASERRSVLEGLFKRATHAEDAFLRAILTGGLRQVQALESSPPP